MYRILIVDDEDTIREGLKEYIEFMGYQVSESRDGAEAIERCKTEQFDLIIMDVMMPKVDGFTACREIKKLKDVPILILSARSEEYDKLFGFELGIDDYVTKPFSAKEVLARIQAIIARSKSKEQKTQTAHEVYEVEGLKIDISARDIFVDEKKVELTPKEYDLLCYLVRNKNIALSREKLLSEVWGYDFFGDDRTIDTHIKMIRNRLGKYKEHVVTVRGVGYKFES